MNLNKIYKNKYICAPLKIKIGNIDVTKYLQRLRLWKKN